MGIFSERVRALTSSNHFLKKQVAEGAGIPMRTYQRYENGEREPSASIITSIADFFNVSADYLLGRSDEPHLLDKKTLTLVRQLQGVPQSAEGGAKA